MPQLKPYPKFFRQNKPELKPEPKQSDPLDRLYAYAAPSITKVLAELTEDIEFSCVLDHGGEPIRWKSSIVVAVDIAIKNSVGHQSPMSLTATRWSPTSEKIIRIELVDGYIALV